MSYWGNMFRFNRKPDLCIEESNLRIWFDQERIMAVGRKNQVLMLRINVATLEFKRMNSNSWSPYPTINTNLIVNKIIECQLFGDINEDSSV
jgi:hypothetical protein